MNQEFAKSSSNEFLAKHSVQINASLPYIEAQEELRPQNSVAVASRCVVLSYVIGIGFGADVKRLKNSLENFGLFEQASAKEQALLSKTEHTPQEKVDATWLTECVQSLAWCLSLVDLDPFRRCDDDLASHFPAPFADPTEFIQSGTLRPLDDIYLQSDLHYRLHWAARNARLTGIPSKAVEGLISERRKAIDWVIGVEADWDEVPLDT